MKRRRAGMTLLELAIAIALTGAVVAIAAGMMRSLSAVPPALRAQHAHMESRIRAERELVTRLRSREQDAPFEGATTAFSFSSRSLGMDQHFSTVTVRVDLVDKELVVSSGARRMVLASCVEQFRVQYLITQGATLGWVDNWGPSKAAPRRITMRWRMEPTCGGTFDSVSLLSPDVG